MGLVHVGNGKEEVLNGTLHKTHKTVSCLAGLQTYLVGVQPPEEKI